MRSPLAFALTAAAMSSSSNVLISASDAIAAGDAVHGGLYSDNLCTIGVPFLSGLYDRHADCTVPDDSYGASMKITCGALHSASSWSLSLYSSPDCQSHDSVPTTTVTAATAACTSIPNTQLFAVVNCGAAGTDPLHPGRSSVRRTLSVHDEYAQAHAAQDAALKKFTADAAAANSWYQSKANNAAGASTGSNTQQNKGSGVNTASNAQQNKGAGASTASYAQSNSGGSVNTASKSASPVVITAGQMSTARAAGLNFKVSSAHKSTSLLFSAYKDAGLGIDRSGNMFTSVTGTPLTFPTKIKADGVKLVTIAFAVGGSGGKFTCSTEKGWTTYVNRWQSPMLMGFDFDLDSTNVAMSAVDVHQLLSHIPTTQPLFPHLRWSISALTNAAPATSVNDGLAASQGAAAASPDSSSVNNFGLSTSFGNSVIMPAIKAVFGFQRKSKSNSWPSYLNLNLLVMDYAHTDKTSCVVQKNLPNHCAMGQSAIQAVMNTADYWKIPLTNLEITPMIGGNDAAPQAATVQTFTAADVDTVVAFAAANKLSAVHMWSYDRDTDCPKQSAGASASPKCNNADKVGKQAYLLKFLTAVNN